MDAHRNYRYGGQYMSNLCAADGCTKTATEAAGTVLADEVFRVPVCSNHYETIIRGR